MLSPTNPSCGSSQALTSKDVGAFLLGGVCEIFGVLPSEIKSKGRHQEISYARWALIQVLVEKECWTYTDVARLLNMHHTGVMYGYDRAKTLYRTDAHFFESVCILEELRNAG